MDLRALPPLLAVAVAVGCATTDPVSTGVGGSDSGSSPSASSSGQGGSASSCGDGLCEPPENPGSCPADCEDLYCGDDLCDDTESCDFCPEDCGACGPVCGDGVCEGAESCSSCELDCGACVCELDAFEPNQGSVSATVVSPGVDYCSLSICAGDVDWFRFNVTSSLDVRIEFSHAEGDLDVEIYAPSYVAGSYSKTDDERVTLNNLSPGVYYARVYGFGHTAQGGGAENWDYCFRVDL